MSTNAIDTRTQLRARVDHWARRVKVAPRVIRIQRMVRKWGSCSTNGTITLADELTSRSTRFQDVVIVHELLHLRVPNHSRLFKALMSVYVPAWREELVTRPRGR